MTPGVTSFRVLSDWLPWPTWPQSPPSEWRALATWWYSFLTDDKVSHSMDCSGNGRTLVLDSRALYHFHSFIHLTSFILNWDSNISTSWVRLKLLSTPHVRTGNLHLLDTKFCISSSEILWWNALMNFVQLCLQILPLHFNNLTPMLPTTATAQLS